MTLDPYGRIMVYGQLAQALEELGWTRDKDMAAHAYDWRWGVPTHAALAFLLQGARFI